MAVSAKSLEKLTKTGKSSWKGLIKGIEAKIDATILDQCKKTVDTKAYDNCREITDDVHYYDPKFQWYSNTFSFTIGYSEMYLSNESPNTNAGENNRLEMEKLLLRRLHQAAREIKKDYENTGWRVQSKVGYGFVSDPECEFTFKFK